MVNNDNQFFIEACHSPKNIKIKTSTRYDGFSKAPFDSLNMGFFSGDDFTNVIKNYQKYQNISKTYNIIILNQVHGNDILEVHHNNMLDVMFSKADGLFSSDYNIALGVITADCLPVMITGSNYISSLHCGWRSLNSGIIDNAFKLFEKYNDKPIYAYIGTGICKNCYEVRDDLISQLNPAYNPEEAIKNMGQGRYLLNLSKLATNTLTYNGLSIDNIEISKYTSCCDKRFYSYRKENGKTGRMITTIQKVKNI